MRNNWRKLLFLTFILLSLHFLPPTTSLVFSNFHLARQLTNSFFFRPAMFTFICACSLPKYMTFCWRLCKLLINYWEDCFAVHWPGGDCNFLHLFWLGKPRRLRGLQNLPWNSLAGLSTWALLPKFGLCFPRLLSRLELCLSIRWLVGWESGRKEGKKEGGGVLSCAFNCFRLITHK